jgi:transcriptional regulator with XRE-family HTH domain
MNDINKIYKICGLNIKILRKRSVHSLVELVEKLNLDFSNLSKIERGELKHIY